MNLLDTAKPENVGKVVGFAYQPQAGRGPLGLVGMVPPVALVFLGFFEDPPAATWLGRMRERIFGRSKSPRWKIIGELRYYDPVLGVEFVLPDGYEFDWASTPPALWSVAPPFAFGTTGPGLHDAVYGRKGDMRKTTAGPMDPYTVPDIRLTRAEADSLFYRLVMLEGIASPWLAKAGYEAVHFFGGPTWDAHPDPPA